MILEIDTGTGFVPVACLADLSESEQVETAGTTTRQNGGWRTSRPLQNQKSISGTGIIPVDQAFFSYMDLVTLKRAKTIFDWRVVDDLAVVDDEGKGLISQLDLQVEAGADVVFSFTVQVTEGEGFTPPPPGQSPPTISISSPSPATLYQGQTTDFTVLYGGADSISLAVVDVTINTTGDVVATASVQGTGTLQRIVQVSITSGTGTVGISIAAGTATNANGTAPAAGPSATATVTAPPPPAPSGYALAWDNDPIQSTTPGLTLTAGNGEGTSITGVITSSGGGSPVNVNETFVSTPFGFTVDVSTLPNGILSANITVLGPGGTQTIIPVPTTTKNL